VVAAGSLFGVVSLWQVEGVGFGGGGDTASPTGHATRRHVGARMRWAPRGRGVGGRATIVASACVQVVSASGGRLARSRFAGEVGDARARASSRAMSVGCLEGVVVVCAATPTDQGNRSETRFRVLCEDNAPRTCSLGVVVEYFSPIPGLAFKNAAEEELASRARSWG
jgi:hypothetical protein